MDWKKTIQQIAPTIATALGGPLAGHAVNVLSETVLGRAHGTEDEISAAIEKGLLPGVIADLRKVDQDFRLEMERLSIERDRIDAGDRSSARDMQKAALQQDDKVAKRFVYEYATFVTGVAFLYIFIITLWDIPEKNIRVVDTILGFLLGTLVTTVVNFFFGSSSGSEAKTGILSKIIGKGKDR